MGKHPKYGERKWMRFHGPSEIDTGIGYLYQSQQQGCASVALLYQRALLQNNRSSREGGDTEWSGWRFVAACLGVTQIPCLSPRCPGAYYFTCVLPRT